MRSKDGYTLCQTNKLHQIIRLNMCIVNYKVNEEVKHAYVISGEYLSANLSANDVV